MTPNELIELARKFYKEKAGGKSYVPSLETYAIERRCIDIVDSLLGEIQDRTFATKFFCDGIVTESICNEYIAAYDASEIQIELFTLLRALDNTDRAYICWHCGMEGHKLLSEFITIFDYATLDNLVKRSYVYSELVNRPIIKATVNKKIIHYITGSYGTCYIMKIGGIKNMEKTCFRFDIDDNFVATKDSPLTIKIRENKWEFFRSSDADNTAICVLKNGEPCYIWNELTNGTVFAMERYCYYRHREFQILLDAFQIDKVVNVKEEAAILELHSGIRELSKTFSVYTDGDISVLDVRNINNGRPYQTHIYKVAIDGNASWAIVDTRNSKFHYRTFYCWKESPHAVLKMLNHKGTGLPKMIS